MCLSKLRNVINIDMYMVNTQNRMISMKYLFTFGEKFEDIKMGNKLCYFNLYSYFLDPRSSVWIVGFIMVCTFFFVTKTLNFGHCIVCRLIYGF
jgi:hypothetical protein